MFPSVHRFSSLGSDIIHSLICCDSRGVMAHVFSHALVYEYVLHLRQRIKSWWRKVKCEIKFYTLKYLIRIAEINILKQTKRWQLLHSYHGRFWEFTSLPLFTIKSVDCMWTPGEGLQKLDQTAKERLTLERNELLSFKVSMQWRIPKSRLTEGS